MRAASVFLALALSLLALPASSNPGAATPAVATEPLPGMFSDPLVPTAEQQVQIEQAAQEAVKRFYVAPSAPSAASYYPIWLKAQSRASIEAMYGLLETVHYHQASSTLCKLHQAKIDRAVIRSPFSLSIVLTALQCAEITGDAKAAAHLEAILQARTQHMMAAQRGILLTWPIRVPHYREVYAWAAMHGGQWRMGELLPAPLIDFLSHSVDLISPDQQTQQRYYFDVTTELFGGEVGDKSSSLTRMTDVLLYQEEIEANDGYNSASFFYSRWDWQTPEVHKEHAALLRERLSNAEQQLSAATALVYIAAMDKAFVLEANDLAPLEAAATEKNFDAMLALATAHGLALFPEADPKLTLALVKAMNRLDSQLSSTAHLVALARASGRNFDALLPSLTQDAVQGRLAAKVLLRSIQQRDTPETQPQADAPNADLQTALLDGAYYSRSRFNDIAKKRICRYAELGVTIAKIRCADVLARHPMVTETARAQAMQVAKFKQAFVPVMEQDAKKIPEHCLSAAQENLRFGDPDRALMWRYACKDFADERALFESLVLFLRGANVGEESRASMASALAEAKYSEPEWPHLVAYFSAHSRAAAQLELEKACQADAMGACKLLALQALPWDYAYSANVKKAQEPGPNKALLDRLNALENAAIAAAGRGIKVELERSTPEDWVYFGTDLFQREPLLVKEVRPEGTLIATSDRLCRKQGGSWLCQPSKVSNEVLPGNAKYSHLLSGSLSDATCGKAVCQRLVLHFLTKLDVAAFEFAAQHKAISSLAVWFDPLTQRPIKAEFLAPDLSLRYHYEYDHSFTPKRLPTRCRVVQATISAEQIKSKKHRSIADVLENLEQADAIQNCRF